MSNVCLDRLRVGYEADINRIPSVGSVQALLSPTNLQNSSVSVEQVFQADKLYQAVVSYMAAGQGDALATNFVPGEGYCATNDSEYTTATITLDGKVRKSTKISHNKFLSFCAGRDESVNTVINSMLPEVFASINTQVRGLIATGSILTNGGLGPVSGNAVINTGAGKAPSYDWILAIENELALQSALGEYLVVGGTNVREYGTLSGLACCNLNGINVAGTANNMYFDQTLAAQNGIAFKPGAVQFLDYNQYGPSSDSANAILSPNGNPTRLTTTVDVEINPGVVISLDLIILQDPCGTSWNITLEKIFGVYSAATDVVAAGYNNVFEFEALSI